MGYLLNLAKQTRAAATGAHDADPFHGIPTVDDEREIRAHLDRLCGPGHPDYSEALALALSDPGAALEAFRASVPTCGYSASDLAEVPALASRLHGPGTVEADRVIQRFRRMAPARVPEELGELRMAVMEGDR